MSNKFLATIIMFGAGMASLSAQAPGALHAAPMEQTALSGIVDGLTRHALFALLGAIVLAGAIYIAYVCKHCNDLGTKRNNIHGRSVALVLFVAGLSSFGSSCTAAQRTRANGWLSGTFITMIRRRNKRWRSRTKPRTP